MATEPQPSRQQPATKTIGVADWAPWQVLGMSLSLLVAYYVYGRPSPWLVGLFAAAGMVVGLMMQGIAAGGADRRGLSWLGRVRRIPWSEVTGIRAEQGRWLLESTRGTVALPRWLTNIGALMAEVRRRTQGAQAATTGPPADIMRGWLGLGAEGRLRVEGAELVAALHRRRLVLVVGMALISLAGTELLAGLDVLVPLPLVGGMFAIRYWFRPPHMLVLVDETGIECDTPAGERAVVPWEAVLAVVQEPGAFVLHTAERDIRFAARAPGADVLRRAAQAYLAAREAAGGFVAGPGDAALSPAARLTGEEEHGLSQVDVSPE